jgi:hypothetical protein
MIDVAGNNAFGAGNQQERPGYEQWIVGFVDGEGCFSVPIFRNSTTRLGWQVQPEFVVAQGARSVHVLHDLRRYFGCGRVNVNRRYDNHREDMYRWAVKSMSDLDETIVPFFEQHPLRTAKVEAFERFSTVVRMVRAGDNLSLAGMARIAAIAETMNFRRPSRFLESSEAIRQPPRADLEVKIWS